MDDKRKSEHEAPALPFTRSEEERRLPRRVRMRIARRDDPALMTADAFVASAVSISQRIIGQW